MGSTIPKKIKYNLHYDNLHYADLRDDVLPPPHGTNTSCCVIKKKKKKKKKKLRQLPLETKNTLVSNMTGHRRTELFVRYIHRRILDEEHPYPSKDNLQSKNQNHYVYYIFARI